MDAYALVKTVSYNDKNKIIQLVVNRARSEKEALHVTRKLSNAVETFLNIKPYSLGYIMYDSNIEKAIKSQEPFIISHPRTLVSRQFSEIAHKLMRVNQDRSKNTYGLRGFLHKFINVNNASWYR